jgi:hypothetical protein
MPEVSFIIPVAGYHTEIAERAITSAEAQTIPCNIIRVDDPDSNGPSWARNRGLEKTQASFVVFLDADDWVEPNFVERCLSVWQPDRYVYTDWIKDDLEAVKAYPNPWCDDLQWHPITALLPKAAVDKVGGFDKLPGGEDTEFYWSLTRKVKCCGIHLPEPLFHYTKDGQRSREWLGITNGQGPADFTKNPNYINHMRLIQQRYGKMGCCREYNDLPLPTGEAGDILVRAIWGGNQVKRGMVTGRWYPRTGNGALMKVDPRDADASPNLWRKIDMTDMTDTAHIQQANGVDGIARLMFAGYEKPKPTLAQIQKVQQAQVRPDFQRVVDLARGAYDE